MAHELDAPGGRESNDDATTDRPTAGTDDDARTGLQSGDSTEKKSLLNRRNYMLLSAAAVGTVAVTGGASAETTTVEGIEFDRVVNAVDDLGMDPTGSEPIDDQIVWDDGTLIEFPTGTYRYDGDLQRDLSRYGWVREDEDAEPVLEPANPVSRSSTNTFVYWRDASDVVLKGFEFDYTESGHGGVNGIFADGDAYWIDVTITGPQANHSDVGATIGVAATAADAEIELRNVSLMDGFEGARDASDTQKDPMGIWVSWQHAGDVLLRECAVGHYPDNGLYGSGPGIDSGHGGTVRVEGGVFKNNNISNVRLGTPGSYVRGAEIEIDGDVPRHRNGLNARGIWLREQEGIAVEDVDIEITGSQGSGAIVESQGTGNSTIENVRIEVSDADYIAPIYRRTSGTQAGSTYENVSIVGNADNSGSLSNGAAMYLQDTSGTEIQDCCIQQTGSDRNGIHLLDSADAKIVDTNVNVTGDATVFQRSQASTDGITHEESCPAPELTGGSGNWNEADEQLTLSNTVTVRRLDDESTAAYTLEASDGINDGSNEISAADATTTASGTVGPDNYEDWFWFGEELVDIDVDGRAELYVNGDLVERFDGDDDEVDGGTDDGTDESGGEDDRLSNDDETEGTENETDGTLTLSNTVTVRSVDDQSATYTLEASDGINDGSNEISVADASTTASGTVSADNHEDWYFFGEELVDAAVEAPAELYVNGQLVTVDEIGDGADDETGEEADDEPDDHDAGDEDDTDGGESGPDEDEPRRLTVVGTGTAATYSFTVDGDLEADPDNQCGNVSGSNAEGVVTDGSASYQFTGDVVDFRTDAAAAVYLDGTQVDPEKLAGDGEPWLTNSLIVDGSHTDESSSYDLSVSGTIARSPDLASAEADDTIEPGHVTGTVTDGQDAYRFTGTITYLTVDGSAKLHFDEDGGTI